MARRPWRGPRSASEHKTLSPLYWHVAPAIGSFPILLLVGVFAVVLAGERWAGGDILVPLAAFVSLVVLASALLFTSSKVLLAEDGLWIRHYGGLFERFIPYAEIALVDTLERVGRGAKLKGDKGTFIFVHAVRLTLKNGKRVVIGASSEETETGSKVRFMAGDVASRGTSSPVARQLANAVREQVAAAEDVPPPTPAEAALMRGERTVEEWRAALAASTPAAGDAYRGDATESLWRVVEDDAAPRDARAGAAIVLKSQLDDDGRGRLRVVAEKCDPKLRSALDTALDEVAAEDEIVAALARASNRRE